MGFLNKGNGKNIYFISGLKSQTKPVFFKKAGYLS